mmetsp:Transcript_381/g.560  ORF Transcript_381/g.560 Transcript_381/m.560 type:complete len:236 (+) Transcript_381:208-915(+)
MIFFSSVPSDIALPASEACGPRTGWFFGVKGSISTVPTRVDVRACRILLFFLILVSSSSSVDSLSGITPRESNAFSSSVRSSRTSDLPLFTISLLLNQSVYSSLLIDPEPSMSTSLKILMRSSIDFPTLRAWQIAINSADVIVPSPFTSYRSNSRDARISNIFMEPESSVSINLNRFLISSRTVTGTNPARSNVNSKYSPNRTSSCPVALSIWQAYRKSSSCTSAFNFSYSRCRV